MLVGRRRRVQPERASAHSLRGGQLLHRPTDVHPVLGAQRLHDLRACRRLCGRRRREQHVQQVAALEEVGLDVLLIHGDCGEVGGAGGPQAAQHALSCGDRLQQARRKADRTRSSGQGEAKGERRPQHD